ncbi:MAG: DUF2237 domain-containing protein [Planctomycetota bacterium]|nr:DUF2237 domain-containing protein [Planctomycetota bacterium]
MARNVLGEPLVPCSTEPMTGWFRNGLCETGRGDVGLHCVCVIVTDAFLDYSRARGNDLSTPNPAFDFPGLQAGDQWCLCVRRWQEAWQDGAAPAVVLESTHMTTLEFVDLEDLQKHAAPRDAS